MNDFELRDALLELKPDHDLSVASMTCLQWRNYPQPSGSILIDIYHGRVEHWLRISMSSGQPGVFKYVEIEPEEVVPWLTALLRTRK
jgi:hypothetical protein